MKPEHQEKLQAWVDGEVTEAEARQIGSWVETDPGARALRDNLAAFSRLLHDHEPVRSVPESREFYWSRIRQGIEAAERTAAPHAPGTPALGHHPWRWLAWFLPVGAAALAAVLFLPGGRFQASLTSAPDATRGAPVMTGHEVEGPCEDVTLMTFYSAQDTTTVVWLGQIDFL